MYRNNFILGGTYGNSIDIKSSRSWYINISAYQYFEEDKKGSIEAGKLADLVILDKNPLTVDPQNIENIKVVETIKEGNTIFKA